MHTPEPLIYKTRYQPSAPLIHHSPTIPGPYNRPAIVISASQHWCCLQPVEPQVLKSYLDDLDNCLMEREKDDKGCSVSAASQSCRALALSLRPSCCCLFLPLESIWQKQWQSIERKDGEVLLNQLPSNMIGISCAGGAKWVSASSKDHYLFAFSQVNATKIGSRLGPRVVLRPRFTTRQTFKKYIYLKKKTTDRKKKKRKKDSLNNSTNHAHTARQNGIAASDLTQLAPLR